MNLATKQFTNMKQYQLKPYQDRYTYKRHRPITNKAGKYYNKQGTETFDNYYNLYTMIDGTETRLTDIRSLSYSAAKEPLLYCVSPDSSLIIFSCQCEDYAGLGDTFCMNKEGKNLITLAKAQWMGNELIPYWLKDQRFLYLNQGSSSSEKEPTTLNVINKDGSISILKTWQSFWTGPLSIRYRY